MRRQKIYLETTLFNFYVDEDRGFAHESTLALFNEIATGNYEAFTSRFVIDELNNAPEAKRDRMLNLISEYDIPILETNEEQSGSQTYTSAKKLSLKDSGRTDCISLSQQ